MSVSMDQIKTLRLETGAGVLDAKRALEESDGDVEKAREWIKKRGMAKAAKKADRDTGVGSVFSYVHHNGKVGSLVKLACETDFVAKTDEFIKLGNEIAMQVASMNPETVDELIKQDYLRDSSKTIEQLMKEVSGSTGENIRLEQIARL